MTVAAKNSNLIEALRNDLRLSEWAEAHGTRPKAYFELEAWLTKLHEKLQSEREDQALSLI